MCEVSPQTFGGPIGRAVIHDVDLFGFGSFYPENLFLFPAGLVLTTSNSIRPRVRASLQTGTPIEGAGVDPERVGSCFIYVRPLVRTGYRLAH